MFTLSKAAGSRVPDEIKLSVDKDICISGQAVELDGTIAVAGSAVAGVVASNYAAPGGVSSDLFSPTFPKGPDSGDDVKALVLPVTGTVLFDASITENALNVVGLVANLNATGDGLVYNASGTDFRILEILESGDTGASKVRGVFMIPGYFAA